MFQYGRSSNSIGHPSSVNFDHRVWRSPTMSVIDEYHGSVALQSQRFQNEAILSCTNVNMADTSKLPWSRNLKDIPPIDHSDIHRIAGEKSTTKKSVQRGYRFFWGGYVHNVEVSSSSSNTCSRTIEIRANCYRSQKKNEKAHKVEMRISTGHISVNKCSCTAGKGFCQHQVALLFQICHYQSLGLTTVPEIVSSTSIPQKWNVPARTNGFTTRPITDVTFAKPTHVDLTSATGTSVNKKVRRESGIKSKLYNPVNIPFSELDLPSKMIPLMNPSIQWYQLWAGERETSLVNSNYGYVPKGSLLSYQEKPSLEVVADTGPLSFPCHALNMDFYPFPLPEKDHEMYFSLETSLPKSLEYELETRDQSKCPQWHQLRSQRITSSNFKSVTGRKQNFGNLASDFLKQRHTPTLAMSFGLEHEHEAAIKYAELFNIAIHPVGLFINPSAFHLACSPDRRVYDTNEEPHWGLLEIKCTTKESLAELSYLKAVDGGYQLRSSHKYYEQCMGQMGLTGCVWCDFFVWGGETFYHKERIFFDDPFFAGMKVKLDQFYFKYFLPAVVESKLG